MSKRALCSWSGGKDSCFALMEAAVTGIEPSVFLNVLNESGRISRSHGIPMKILTAQAEAARIPLHCISSSWSEYERRFTDALVLLKNKFDLSCAVFGDIDLQEHRDWEEKVCQAAGLKAVLPLWKRNRKELVIRMIAEGLRAMIVSCNSSMGPGYLGRMITPELVSELEQLGIDPCGENGEYHTLVVDCPLFTNQIDVSVNDRIQHDGYWFSDLTLNEGLPGAK